MKAVLRHAAGWSLLVLGLVGLVLPVLQGWLFLALGALLLAPDVPLFARILCWIEERFPRLRQVTSRLSRRIGGPRPPCPPD